MNAASVVASNPEISIVPSADVFQRNFVDVGPNCRAMRSFNEPMGGAYLQ